jgi:hypothetical protein
VVYLGGAAVDGSVERMRWIFVYDAHLALIHIEDGK